MQVMLMRLMSKHAKGEYLIVPKGTKFTGAGKLGLNVVRLQNDCVNYGWATFSSLTFVFCMT